MNCKYCGRNLDVVDRYRRREHVRLCKNVTPEVRYIHSGIRQKDYPKECAANTNEKTGTSPNS